MKGRYPTEDWEDNSIEREWKGPAQGKVFNVVVWVLVIWMFGLAVVAVTWGLGKAVGWW